MHRFLRLARHAKLSWPELDVALRALGGASAVADLACLDGVGELLRLRDRTGLAIDELCTLWGAPIDTRGFKDQPSLYARLFLSRQVTPGASTAFELDANLDELIAPLVSLPETHYAIIRAGLGINDDDLRRLVEGIFETTPPLDLATLSALFRHVVLARLVGLRVDELLVVLTWSTVDPFVSPGNTIALMDAVAEIDESGMSIAQLDYLFRHEFDPATGIHPSEERISAIVDGILAAIAELDIALAAEQATVSDERAKTLAHLAALGVTETDTLEWLRLLALWEDEPVDELSPGDVDVVTGLLTDLGAQQPDITASIADSDTHLANDEPTDATATALLLPLRRQAGLDALVAQQRATATGLAPEAVAMLANDTELLAASGSTIKDVLIVGPSGGDHVEAVVRMHKAAIVIKGLGVRTADIAWYFANAAEAQTMDLGALPPSVPTEPPTTPPSVHFAGWRRVRLGQELQSSFST